MAHQKLKYGTLVILGLAITGTTIYDIGVKRLQTAPVDYIELFEGRQEREMIVASITTTNLVAIHVATNRASLVELDAAIFALIPKFVNQTAINAWLADYHGQNPPMWTVEELFAHLQIGDHTNRFTRTPAIGTNVATYGAWPIQIYKTDLAERWLVLKTLTHTWDNSRWGSNAVCGDSGSALFDSEADTTNFISSTTNSWGHCTNAPDIWQSVLDEKPSSFPLEGDISGVSFATYCESTTPSLHGLTPFMSQYAALNIHLNMNYSGGSVYSDPPEYRGYTYTNQVATAYLSTNIAARIECDEASSLSISRTDYFYYLNPATGTYVLFESVAVATNTTLSSTSAFVKPPVFEVYCEGTYHFDLDAEDVEASCFGAANLTYGAWKDLATNILLSASQTSTVTNLLPCIHKWTVTRCKE